MVERDARFWRIFNESYEELLPYLRQLDITELNRHNPVFEEGFVEGPMHPENSEWIRYQKTFQLMDKLSKEAGRPLKVLDFGMQTGVLSLTFSRSGQDLYAADDFDFYGPSFTPLHEKLMESITVKTIEGVYEIPYEDDFFDVVSLLAVIEHLPDSPKKLLGEIRRVLKPGGTLIVDTPNSASAYKRILFFLRGVCVFPELKPYFDSEIPFTGHHREYNPAELRQVLEWSGFQVEQFDVFEQRPYKIDSLLTLVQKVMMALVESSRPYLWCTAKKPEAISAG